MKQIHLKFFLIASILLLSCGSFLWTHSVVNFAPVTGKAGQIQKANFYWITFSGDSDNDPIFLMQIDSSGNVIRAPKAVFPAARFGSQTGASALGKNGNKLNLWHWGARNILYRGLINTSTMTAAGLKIIPFVTTSDDDTLQATQKGSKNFLIVETFGRQLEAFPVAASGLPNGKIWELSPKAPRVNDEGSIAPDAGVVITNRNVPDVKRPPADEIYLQLLDANGKPRGTPKLLATIQDIEASDVTNALADGKRFVVYVADKGTVPPDNKLFLQVVGPSGSKIGAPALINVPPTRDQDDQNVAIDQDGRFVIFTIGGNNFGCTGKDILVYQALTPTGKKSGPLKVIAKCGFVRGDIINIDMLKQ